VSAKKGFCVVAPMSALDVGQQHVLLRLVEAVDLIDEQAGPLAVVLQPSSGRIQHVPHVLHARSRRRELDEPPLRLVGDDLGQRRLADARWPVQDHRPEPVGLDEPSQQHPLADDLLLPDVVGQPPRPHPGSERSRSGDVGGSRGGEQVGHDVGGWQPGRTAQEGKRSGNRGWPANLKRSHRSCR